MAKAPRASGTSGPPRVYYMCAFIICTGLWLWGAAASTILANLPLFLAHASVQEPRKKRNRPAQANMFSAIVARPGRLQAADAQASSSLVPCPNCGPEPGVPCSHFGLVAAPTRPPARRPSLRASVCFQDGFSRIHQPGDVYFMIS